MTLIELRDRLRGKQGERKKLLALAAVSSLTIAMAWRMWELHTPPELRGILTGNGWTWDDAIQGYRGRDGQVIAGEKLKTLALKISDSIKRDMRKQAWLLGLGIPTFLWQYDFGSKVAGAFILMGALAAGGIEKLTPGMQRVILGSERKPGGLKYSISRLLRWRRQIDEKRDGPDEADVEPPGMTTEARAGMYSDSAHVVFENVRVMSHELAKIANGAKRFLYYRNLLSPADHCKDTQWTDGCLTVTEAGWQPIGTLPDIGARTCKNMCKCSWEFSYTGDEEKPSGS